MNVLSSAAAAAARLVLLIDSLPPVEGKEEGKEGKEGKEEALIIAGCLTLLCYWNSSQLAARSSQAEQKGKGRKGDGCDREAREQTGTANGSSVGIRDVLWKLLGREAEGCFGIGVVVGVVGSHAYVEKLPFSASSYTG